MKVGALMRPSRFEELVKSGLFSSSRAYDSKDCKSEFMTEPLTGCDLTFTLLDISRLPAKQNFDIIIHKISDFMNAEDEFHTARAFLTAFADQTKAGLVLDPIDLVVKVFDRVQLASFVSGLSLEHDSSASPSLCSPSFVEVTENDDLEDVVSRAEAAGLHLPCILKDAAACGVPEAHHMQLVIRWTGLSDRPRRRQILQQFFNHSGVIYKLYVLDQMVHCLQKKSIPDLPQDTCRLSSTISFDSLAAQELWLAHTSLQGSRARSPPAADEGVLHKAAHALQQALQLSLFGFDVVVDYSGVHYVIDVNYFPSYKGVPDARAALGGLLERKLIASK